MMRKAKSELYEFECLSNSYVHGLYALRTIRFHDKITEVSSTAPRP